MFALQVHLPHLHLMLSTTMSPHLTWLIHQALSKLTQMLQDKLFGPRHKLLNPRHKQGLISSRKHLNLRLRMQKHLNLRLRMQKQVPHGRRALQVRVLLVCGVKPAFSVLRLAV